MRVKISHQFWVFVVCKTMPSLSCQLCEKHYSTHDWTVYLCWFEKKKTSRCQKYLEISSFMLTFWQTSHQNIQCTFLECLPLSDLWHNHGTAEVHTGKPHTRSYFMKNSCHKCVKSNRHSKAKINHITKVEDSRNNIYWVRCVTDHAFK